MTLALQKILAEHDRWLTSGGRLGVRADLTRWNLSGEDLSDLDLTGVIFHGANLRGANLAGSVMCHADLSRAVLTGADVRDVDLARANLRGTDLSGVRNLQMVKNFWITPYGSALLPSTPSQPPQAD